MRRLTLVLCLALTMVAFPAATSSPAEAEQVVVACANNTTDDEKLNTAIAATSPGDEVVFEGTCLIDGTIKLLGERAYRGHSRAGTVIRQAAGANLPAMLASDSYLDNVPYTGLPVAVESVSLDGNRAANPAAGDALVLRSWQSTVEDVEIFGANRHGLRLTNLSANGTALQNTQVNGRIVGNHVAESGGRGIFVEDTGNSVTDWQLLDNWIADSGSDGIALDNTAGWMVQRNHVYGVGGTAIAAQRLFASTVSDNYIEDFATAGLQASLQGDAASTIANNRIFRFNGGGGTFLSLGVNYGTGNATVTGNAIRGGGTGIGLDYQLGGGTACQLASTGNLVTGVTTPRRVAAGVTVTAGL
ncbi:right-handed parallel beta-helix repeat-containing protein [Amycolatopsis lurida]